MFELRFEIDGKRVDPNHVGDALEKAVLKSIADQVSAKVRSVKCTEHGPRDSHCERPVAWTPVL